MTNFTKPFPLCDIRQFKGLLKKKQVAAVNMVLILNVISLNN